MKTVSIKEEDVTKKSYSPNSILPDEIIEFFMILFRDEKAITFLMDNHILKRNLFCCHLDTSLRFVFLG